MDPECISIKTVTFEPTALADGSAAYNGDIVGLVTTTVEINGQEIVVWFYMAPSDDEWQIDDDVPETSDILREVCADDLAGDAARDAIVALFNEMLGNIHTELRIQQFAVEISSGEVNVSSIMTEGMTSHEVMETVASIAAAAHSTIARPRKSS